MNKKQGGNLAALSPTDFIAAVTQRIPDKGFQLVRYYGWYRLAGDNATVDSNVETQNGGVFLEHEISRSSEQLLAGTHFGHSKVKIVACMPLWDNEQVPFRYWILILHDHGEAVLEQDLRSGH